MFITSVSFVPHSTFLVSGNKYHKTSWGHLRLALTCFDIQMIVKSSAMEIIFKSYEPLHRYQLTGPANSAQKRLVRFENNFNDITLHCHFYVKTGRVHVF